MVITSMSVAPSHLHDKISDSSDAGTIGLGDAATILPSGFPKAKVMVIYVKLTSKL